MKISKLLTISLITLSLFGCNSKPDEPTPLNANRGTNYEYDFLDYISLTPIGPNGEATLVVEPKEFNMKDFDSEEDYIKVRKAMDSLKSYIGVDPNGNVSNGDIVNIGISTNYQGYAQEINMNLETYQLEVKRLEEPKELDLFSDDNFLLYGLNGTREAYGFVKKDSKMSDILKDNLEFKITAPSGNLVPNESILKIEAKISDDYIKNLETPWITTDLIIKDEGYIANTSTEKVLINMVDPIDFKNVNIESMKSLLMDELGKLSFNTKNMDYSVYQLGTVQQYQENNSPSNKFDYIVTSIWHNMNEEKVCIRNTVKMIETKDGYKVLSITSPENIKESYCSEKYENTNMLINYNNTIVDDTDNTEKEATE